jgi:hypothetical protein
VAALEAEKKQVNELLTARSQTDQRLNDTEKKLHVTEKAVVAFQTALRENETRKAALRNSYVNEQLPLVKMGVAMAIVEADIFRLSVETKISKAVQESATR